MPAARRGRYTFVRHPTQIASSIATDSYSDQVAFFPGETGQEFVK